MSKVLRQQLELVPEDVRARILLANNLANSGETEEVARHLKTAVALRPGDAAAQKQLTGKAAALTQARQTASGSLAGPIRPKNGKQSANDVE